MKMRIQIENILKSILPQDIWLYVSESSVMNEPIIKIAFAVKDYNINNVSGQKPQIVSLRLYTNTLILKPQVFGGNGGNYIYRKPNLNDSKEKYLCMKGVKIPFRTPKPERDNVLKAIKLFAENWVNILKENQGVLMYQDIVNYNEILK
jgi:hypothetical protein